MRVLDTATKALTDEDGEDQPYAILSHTWGSTEDEVTFQQLQKLMESADPASHPVSSKPGYRKISECCSLAQRHNFRRLWIDTCCIDKTSSAELSEAINSMYRWYQHAVVCYVYLADVSADDVIRAPGSQFRQSRWFTRGWTLQELIAPAKLLFFSKTWTLLGERDDLAEVIENITLVPIKSLSTQRLSQFSIAQRMSWASRRQTKRIEDTAYCLMGIFNVNMPLIYGEKSNAFHRLQEAIIENNRDESILAWGYGQADPPNLDYKYASVLASSPSDFSHCHDIVSCISDTVPTRQNFETTKRGISIATRRLKRFDNAKRCTILLAPLMCRPADDYEGIIALVIEKDGPTYLSDQYHRVASYLPLRVRWSDVLRHPLKATYMQIGHTGHRNTDESQPGKYPRIPEYHLNSVNLILKIPPVLNHHTLHFDGASYKSVTSRHFIFKTENDDNYISCELSDPNAERTVLWIYIRIRLKYVWHILWRLVNWWYALGHKVLPYAPKDNASFPRNMASNVHCSFALAPATTVHETAATMKQMQWKQTITMLGAEIRPEVDMIKLPGDPNFSHKITLKLTPREPAVSEADQDHEVTDSLSSPLWTVTYNSPLQKIVLLQTIALSILFLVVALLAHKESVSRTPHELRSTLLYLYIGTLLASILVQKAPRGQRLWAIVSVGVTMLILGLPTDI